MVIRPGEIYWAEFPTGRRPAVVVSREDLNRGGYVVVVPLTSAHFNTRSTLSHCVPFPAGEFGLTKDCVAQTELIAFVTVDDIDQDIGLIGTLDDERSRDIVRAVGDMMGAECELS